MRVHPGFLAPSNRRWQFPAIVALILLLLSMGFYRGSTKQEIVSQPVPLKEVVVAKSHILAGESLNRTKLTLEKRAISSLPSDVVTSYVETDGKVAIGPIPAGYPLAKLLISDPLSSISASEASNQKSQLDPFEKVLQEIQDETVAITITFATVAPSRGKRVALALNSPEGETILILDEAWVSHSSDRNATLRVASEKALFISSVLKYGQMIYLELPSDGANPYKDKAARNADEVKRLLGLIKGPAPINEPSSEDQTFRSYAWINGTSLRYGIDENGQIFMVDENGVRVAGPITGLFK